MLQLSLPSLYSGGQPHSTERPSWNRAGILRPGGQHVPGIVSLPEAALLSLLLGSQHAACQLSDVFPGQLHVGRLHSARAHSEAEHELVSETARYQVDFFGAVNSL